MARARNIKPAFFKNEALADSSCETRLLFIGLWTLADREGRLEDRPRRIRAEIFPFDGFDVESMLAELEKLNFIIRYEVDEIKFIQIINFVKHQDPHYREKESEIPAPPGLTNEIVATSVTRTQRARILERDNYKCQQCESGEHLCIDHVLPVSKGGDSSDDNLQVLCLSCNTKKGNKIDSMSSQRRVNVESKDSLHVTLIPDSLIPDSLIPDSLIPDSLIPDSLIPDSDILPSREIKQQPKMEIQENDSWSSGELPEKQKVIISLPLNVTGTFYEVTQESVDKWVKIYPAVDVLQEIRNMFGWLDANQSKRKTKTGIKSFVNSWLAREQNKGGKKTQEAQISNFSGYRPKQPPTRPDYGEYEPSPDLYDSMQIITGERIA